MNNIGYSLVFSTILAKLGRIYFIFHNPMKARKRVSTRNANTHSWSQKFTDSCPVILCCTYTNFVVCLLVHVMMLYLSQNISDWRMACFICIDIVIVVVILIIGNSIPFTRPNAHTIRDAETPPREVSTCTSIRYYTVEVITWVIFV